MFKVPENYRITTGPLGSDASYGNNGAFVMRVGSRKRKVMLKCIASDGEGWEHVSVTCPTRTPTWQDMCRVKDLFWDDDDCVIQFHPPKQDYVDNHPGCLHLWRRAGTNDYVDRPHAALIGVLCDNPGDEAALRAELIHALGG